MRLIDLDKWQEIFHTIWQNKLRTFLTVLGVSWGIFMLVVMIGAGNGLENGVYQGMGDFATNSVFIWGEQSSMAYKGLPRGRRIRFNSDDTKAIKEQISEIETISARMQVRTWEGEGENNVTRGLETGAFSIMGDYPDINNIDPMTIISGRFINYLDIEQKRKVAVIGARVKDVLFKEHEDAVGDYIKIKGIYFQVVGVFKSKHTGGWAEHQEQSIFLPFTTLQQVYNYGGEVGWYSLTSKGNIPASVVEKKVMALLKKRHKIHPDDQQALGKHNIEEEFQKISGLFIGIRILIWVVGSGTLLAGVIGVSNIMLVIIKERTKEIGIQRALGATPSKVIWHILTESVFLTTLAGYFGLLFGTLVVHAINKALPQDSNEQTMFTNPEVSFSVVMAALIILIIAGALAGMLPASRAVRIKPIDALRSE